MDVSGERRGPVCVDVSGERRGPVWMCQVKGGVLCGCVR